MLLSAIVLTTLLAYLLWRVIPALVRLLRTRSIPTFPGDRLLGGHLWMLRPGALPLKERTEIYLQCPAKVGRFNFSLGLPYLIVLLHPDAVDKVYNSNIEVKENSGFVPLLGKSLVMSGGARWKRNRSLLKQAFGRQQIRGFFLTFRALARELVDHWERKLKENHVTDGEARTLSVIVDGYFTRLTMESILRCAFASEEPGWVEKTPEYGTLIDEFLKLHMQRYANPLNTFSFYYFNFTKAGKRTKEVAKTTLKIARELLDKRKKTLEEKSGGNDSSQRRCVIDILLKARDPESGEGMPEEDMLFECNLFLFAGYDTSRLALTWLFYLLSSHPDEQHRCQEEVDSLFQDQDDISWEDLTKLSYLTRCIKEAMRLYPPVGGDVRIVSQDIDIDGYTIPKGMKAGPFNMALHYNPEFWEKPNEFYPNHFSPEQEAKRPAGVFRPFSTGPRRCLGEIFAMEEIKTVAAYLLWKFNFSLDPDHEVTDILVGFLKPKNGVKVIMTTRDE